MADDWVRWNTHHSTNVDVEMFGTTFSLKQDPNSLNLGTTVWDSSIVFAKFVEQNAKRGDFSRQRLRGKQAIDLGAGMGLCGLALAAMGANVLSTDLAPVLPLLEHNCSSNLRPSAVEGLPWAKEAGKVEVKELDWYNHLHTQEALSHGPFDYLLAADCVYNEEHLPAFRDTCLALMTAKSLLVVINELRSESVHSRFLELMAEEFSHKKVPHSRMGSVQHPNIDIFLFRKLKKS